MIEDLVALSQDPAPEKRRQLLREVADLFLNDVETYSDRSLVLFTDVLTGLLKQVDESTRAEIAERLSDAPNAGEALHMFLAYDEVEVAGPVLRNSRHLSDEVLVDIAEHKGQAHRLAIAMRETLTESVTDILIAKGESPVLRAVTGNFGASISTSSFATLADHARTDDTLLDAMSYRADMPRQVADTVLNLLPEDARIRLAALLAADREAVRPLMEKAAALTKQKKMSRALERLETKGLIRQVRQKEMTLEQVIVWLSERDRILDLSLVLSDFSRIDEAVATGAILKVNAAPAVILLRSLEVDEDAVRAVAIMRCRRLNLPQSMADHLVDRWRELDEPTAQRALRFTLARRSVQQDAA
ncbi:DUF2336 domain-containing protein [Microbaculum sp. FT89]|uniref:DUF2336 domain-containing protein n=1 Tax=Microbaculum sp. FT89 TaxID=3447298 RepID=UPI003F52D418